MPAGVLHALGFMLHSEAMLHKAALPLLVVVASAHAASITSVSATIFGAPDIPACMQTDPVQSSCVVGRLSQNSSYAEGDAIIFAPGGFRLQTQQTGSGTELHFTFGTASASASFSYEIEAVGGIGQVLIAPDSLVDRASCFSQPNIGCSPPTVTIGPGPGTPGFVSGFPFLATFGVPFPFTGSGTASGLKPNFNEGESETVLLIYPVSSLLLLDPNTLLPVSGSVIILADTPEPITALTVLCGVLGVVALRKTVSAFTY